MAHQHCVLEVERFHHLGEIVGIGIHVIAMPRLAGAAMTSAIVSDTAIALARQEEHLIFERVAVQRIRMVENDGLPFSPIFEIKFGAVFGGDGVHIDCFLASGDGRSTRWRNVRDCTALYSFHVPEALHGRMRLAASLLGLDTTISRGTRKFVIRRSFVVNMRNFRNVPP
ncbi:MAG: hypothetical protein WDN28_12325 [Chthoniobacter sp.]